MKIGESGLALIRTFEQFRAKAYPDPGSADGTPWTIGWGATTYEDGSPVRQGDVIDRVRGDALLEYHVGRAESRVRSLLTVPIEQHHFDALVSFEYNTGALGSSTLLRKINAGDFAGAAAEFDRWINNDGKPMDGLRNRRRAERAIFETSLGAPIEARTVPPTSGVRPEPAPQPKPEPTMGPFVIPALSALAQLIPTVAELFKGEPPSKVADRNVEAFKAIADKVLPIVLAATGAPNAQAAVEAVQADPSLATQADDALRREYYELQRVSVKEARDFAVSYAQIRDVRTVVGRFTFLEFLTLVIVGISALLTGWLIHLGLLAGELLGAVVTLVLVAGFVDVRKFWLGLPASDPPQDQRPK